MDIRESKWYAQLAVSGIGAPHNFEGSILSISGDMNRALQQLSPRKLASGEIEISLRIRSIPFGADKETDSLLAKAAEVEARIAEPSDLEEGNPLPGESFEQYYDRLIAQGHTPASANWFACDWFDKPQDPDLESWLVDPKAVRFRRLNCVQAEYDAALPSEYEELKHYVVANYAKFTDSMTFRKA